MSRKPLHVVAGFNQDQCIGAALVISFFEDLFTISPKERYSRDEIILILDSIGQRELPEGLLDFVKEKAEENKG